MQVPAVTEAAVTAHVPGAAGVLAPVLGVVAELEGDGPAAAFDFEQGDREVEVAGAHVDVLAAAAPVAAGAPHPVWRASTEPSAGVRFIMEPSGKPNGNPRV